MNKIEDTISDWLAYLIFEPLFYCVRVVATVLVALVVFPIAFFQHTWKFWVAVAACIYVFS